MGLFYGKYVIVLQKEDGSYAFYMSISKEYDHIQCTKRIDVAEKFITYNGALKVFHEKIEPRMFRYGNDVTEAWILDYKKAMKYNG